MQVIIKYFLEFLKYCGIFHCVTTKPFECINSQFTAENYTFSFIPAHRYTFCLYECQLKTSNQILPTTCPPIFLKHTAVADPSHQMFSSTASKSCIKGLQLTNLAMLKNIFRAIIHSTPMKIAFLRQYSN